MTSVDLRRSKIGLGELLHLAEEDSVLVVADDGRRFILSEADDLDAEVEALGRSPRFRSFLDERMRGAGRTPIEEIERELEEELAR